MRDHLPSPKEAMLAELERVGWDETQPAKLQPQMIDAAEVWLRHWAPLLLENPPSAVGPLSSLMAAAYWAGQQAGQKEGVTRMQVDQMAALAYGAYAEKTEWKNYRGEPMPKWTELPPAIREAWVAATRKIVDLCFYPERTP